MTYAIDNLKFSCHTFNIVAEKEGGKAMKVLVHLNHGFDKSYLLSFDKEMTADRLKKISEYPGPDRAIQVFMMYSSKQIEVASTDRQKAEGLASFTISQKGYSIERLA